MVMTTLDFMGVEREDPELPQQQQLGGSNSEIQKRLEELSEEEILQLTREDCRRYLKDKGMRRPSWNKAQALQQVLSLRSLCEQAPKMEDGAIKEQARAIPGCFAQQPPPQQKQQQQLKRTLSSTFLESSTTTSTAKKPMVASNGVSQLTMFYAGMVAVYEDIPADKAHAIMLLAGDMLNANNTAAARLFLPGKNVAFSAAAARPIQELPQARKASLQRFLQKRRERMTSAPTEHSEKKLETEENKNCYQAAAAAAAVAAAAADAVPTGCEIEVSSH